MEVRGLFETFLRQLSLPRLVHFFDLVLAQMVPRWESSAGQARSRLVCHILRIKDDARNRGRDTAPLRFSFRLQFLSHAGICHIAVHWQHNEVLLFNDPAHVGLEDPQTFHTSTALEHHRKNIQLGLRIGQAALISFTVDGRPIAEASKCRSGSSTRGWKTCISVSACWKSCWPSIRNLLLPLFCLNLFFLLQRCLGKARAVRPSVSKAKETTGMYNGPLNKLPR